MFLTLAILNIIYECMVLHSTVLYCICKKHENKSSSVSDVDSCIIVMHPASPRFYPTTRYRYPNGGGGSDPSLTPTSCYQNALKDERRDPSGGGGATTGYNDLPVNNNKFNSTNKHNSKGTTRVISYLPLNGQKGKQPYNQILVHNLAYKTL
jgi:hypothetical protein